MTPLQGFGMYFGGPNPGFAARAITFCPYRAPDAEVVPAMKPVWRGLSHFALGGQPDAEVVAAMKPAWRGLSHFAFGGQPDLCPGTGVPVAREKEYPKTVQSGLQKRNRSPRHSQAGLRFGFEHPEENST